MLALTLGSVLLAACFANGLPAGTNAKDGSQVAELPENWDQTKDDTQSLFLNKDDKNDLEPYPLALSEEGNVEGYDQGVDQRTFEGPANGGVELDNLIMRPALYGEPPAMEAMAQGYDSRRKKRGSGTKVGGAGAATKVATKGSGKKNLKEPTEARRKRDSGLSAADVRALLSLWEAQEQRRKTWTPNQWAERYYGRGDDTQDDNGEIWYNEPMVFSSHDRDYPHSYFSEQNRLALARYPDLEDGLKYEEARRKRQYLTGNKIKRFMVARKREVPVHQPYRGRDDLYTLAELLRNAPRVHDQDIPAYRRFVL